MSGSIPTMLIICLTFALRTNSALSHLRMSSVFFTVSSQHDCSHHKQLCHCLTLCMSFTASRLNISDSDMLTITDGDEITTRILGRYVGGSSPFKLSSTTPDLTIAFHSDPAGLVFGKGEGFIISYMGESD